MRLQSSWANSLDVRTISLVASKRPGMAIWRDKLFSWMLRNAESAMEFFKLPANRVVELGSQVEI